jgi:hypothetical protein
MRWLDEGVKQGIISAAQRDQLARLAAQSDAAGAAPQSETAGGFNWVSAAYTVGALLVCFALAWFLFDRWSTLGPGGVLAVTSGYAALFSATAYGLDRRGFPRAASLAIVLAIACVPLMTWAVLTLAGEWPRPGARGDAFAERDAFVRTRWLVVELTTMLAALLVLRRRRSALVALPVAVALWWVSFHLARMFGYEWFTLGWQRWTLLGNGLLMLAIAERIERWQRRTRGEPGADESDYAQSFWVVGMLGFTFAYAATWDRSDGWRHFLAPLSIGIIALSLVVHRRIVFAFGIIGVFLYLAFLSSDVFRTGASFPLVLAVLGLAVILLAVWIQRRFPGLLTHSGEDRFRPLPWSPVMAWVPAAFAFAMALLASTDAQEERAQREFRQRLTILQAHSGSVRARNGVPLRRAPQATPAPR